MKITSLLDYLSMEVSTSNQNSTSTLVTRGLLGVPDGDQGNDLTAEDGTVLPLSSTDYQIYTQFGQTCKIFTITQM